jgi:hypothetical protein
MELFSDFFLFMNWMSLSLLALWPYVGLLHQPLMMVVVVMNVDAYGALLEW